MLHLLVDVSNCTSFMCQCTKKVTEITKTSTKLWKNWAGVHKLWKPDNRKKLLQRNWNLASGKVGRYDWRFTEEVRRCASPFPDSQRAQQACASLENHSDSLEVAME